MSRDKGQRIEREVVNAHLELGISRGHLMESFLFFAGLGIFAACLCWGLSKL